MAMAPTHTTREAVTNPWTNWLSPFRSALAFSQMPRRSICRSKSKNSPTRVPKARARIMERVAAVSREASFPPWTERAPAMAPAAPMKRVPSPMAFMSPSW